MQKKQHHGCNCDVYTLIYIFEIRDFVKWSCIGNNIIIYVPVHFETHVDKCARGGRQITFNKVIKWLLWKVICLKDALSTSYVTIFNCMNMYDTRSIMGTIEEKSIESSQHCMINEWFGSQDDQGSSQAISEHHTSLVIQIIFSDIFQIYTYVIVLKIINSFVLLERSHVVQCLKSKRWWVGLNFHIKQSTKIIKFPLWGLFLLWILKTDLNNNHWPI